MANTVRLLFILVLWASLLVWPLSAIFAYVLLQSPANPWTPLAYALIVLLVIHFPLMAWARRRAIAGGSSLTRRGKLGLIMPPALNALLLFGLVAYLGAVCSWRFSCVPA
jgi:hypothetical protein